MTTQKKGNPTNLTIYLLLLLMSSIGVTRAEEPNWDVYQAVLQHIGPGIKNGVKLTLVDYATLKRNGAIEQAYQTISSFDLARLRNREEKLAFYINAYNILALKMVVDHWPLTSIKDIGSILFPVWYKRAGKLGSKNVTLDYIEHHILRPMGEPRIHMAIVCASVSCPNLRGEPYTAAKLYAQLDEQTANFLANKGKGLKIEPNTIHVSQIFDWFAKDFVPVGGLSVFLKRYIRLPDLKIKADLPYDWTVNG